MSEASEERDTGPAALIAAASWSLGLDVPARARPGVERNLARTAAMAALLEEDASAEPASSYGAPADGTRDG